MEASCCGLLCGGSGGVLEIPRGKALQVVLDVSLEQIAPSETERFSGCDDDVVRQVYIEQSGGVF